MLSPSQIKSSKKALKKLKEEFKRKSGFYCALSDITRLKILYLLKLYKELCPSDIAEVLEMSLSAVSHQLNFLEREGLLEKRRVGRMICYRLTRKGKGI
jgi:DNA-binding transcriptional ArsR family regulator